MLRVVRGDLDRSALPSPQDFGPLPLVLPGFLRWLFTGGMLAQFSDSTTPRQMPPGQGALGESALGEVLAIEGHDVYWYASQIHGSPLGSPTGAAAADPNIHSYVVADGPHVLLTNSRYLVRRFLQAGRGRGSLAQLPEFHAARREVPADERSSCFVFLSDQFLENANTPLYLIETRRRAIAGAELEMVTLARHVARAAGQPADSVEDLVASGLLPERSCVPERFRPCRSRAAIDGDVVCDSLRGLPGGFLPVPDVAPGRLDGDERALVKGTTRASPPCMWLSVSRSRVAEDRVCLQARIGMPFTQRAWPLDQRLPRLVHLIRKLGLADDPRELVDLLSPPSQVQIDPIPGTVATLEIGFRTAAKRTFAGLQDWQSAPIPVSDSVLDVGDRDPFAGIRGYVGETSSDGLLGSVLLPAYGSANAAGFSCSRYKHPDLLRWMVRSADQEAVVFAPQTAILQSVVPHLVVREDAARAAQVRLRLFDLASSELAGVLRQIAYRNARQTSAANVCLLQVLTDHLELDSPAAIATAEALGGYRLICPLSGTYQIQPDDRGDPRWHSTACSPSGLKEGHGLPTDFRLPLLDDLRELSVDVVLAPRGLLAFIDLQLDPAYFLGRETDRVRAALASLHEQPATWPKVHELVNLSKAPGRLVHAIAEALLQTVDELADATEPQTAQVEELRLTLKTLRGLRTHSDIECDPQLVEQIRSHELSLLKRFPVGPPNLQPPGYTSNARNFWLNCVRGMPDGTNGHVSTRSTGN